MQLSKNSFSLSFPKAVDSLPNKCKLDQKDQKRLFPRSVYFCYLFAIFLTPPNERESALEIFHIGFCHERSLRPFFVETLEFYEARMNRIGKTLGAVSKELDRVLKWKVLGVLTPSLTLTNEKRFSQCFIEGTYFLPDLFEIISNKFWAVEDPKTIFDW